MLTIFAHSMMTATRQNCTPLDDVAPPPKNRREKLRRWVSGRRQVCVDLNKL